MDSVHRGKNEGRALDDVELMARVREDVQRLRNEVAKVIVGQGDVVEQLLIALLARGHCLVVGVPGLAKTLLIQTLARTLGLSYRRIQFTPDLMPSDVTGTELLAEERGTGRREFRFVPGPVFANVVLGDEINRTPPKTQAALLEAMQERHVTIAGQRHELPAPFFVLATQNPIEQEGTYPLPEAQLDRFLLNVRVDYPTPAEECAIVERTTTDADANVQVVLSAAQLAAMQGLTRRIPTAAHAIQFAVDLVRKTRPTTAEAPSFVREHVTWGAGPRGAQSLILAAKARALLRGEYCVATTDIVALALPVLRHRLITNFRAESEGVTADGIVTRLVEH